MHYIQALRRRGEETGGPAHPLPPPSHAHTHTFYEIVLCLGCFLGNLLLCHSPRHSKHFWLRHSQILVGGPVIFTFKIPWKLIFSASKKKSGSYKFQIFPNHSGLIYFGFSKQQLL